MNRPGLHSRHHLLAAGLLGPKPLLGHQDLLELKETRVRLGRLENERASEQSHQQMAVMAVAVVVAVPLLLRQVSMM